MHAVRAAHEIGGYFGDAQEAYFAFPDEIGHSTDRVFVGHHGVGAPGLVDVDHIRRCKE